MNADEKNNIILDRLQERLIGLVTTLKESRGLTINTSQDNYILGQEDAWLEEINFIKATLKAANVEVED